MSSVQSRPLWSAAGLNSAFRIAILACLVATMSYLAAKLGTTVVIRDTLDWPLWPGKYSPGMHAVVPSSQNLADSNRSGPCDICVL